MVRAGVAFAPDITTDWVCKAASQPSLPHDGVQAFDLWARAARIRHGSQLGALQHMGSTRGSNNATHFLQLVSPATGHQKFLCGPTSRTQLRTCHLKMSPTGLTSADEVNQLSQEVGQPDSKERQAYDDALGTVEAETNLTKQMEEGNTNPAGLNAVEQQAYNREIQREVQEAQTAQTGGR
mmetsp:Transcript_30614/g.60058  ORF Transcript_30614/g.60058 Transcript_30614/m.60058 type:complete len:181 (-) Transcript_30614:122-664(-)|eukprot:CAMPEP_0172687240 /NCGR_PEP_ID=MMETSP1074-20121228/21532_1 /TAXON_ID=2916 /ORGANISM="Ceratium fusus, Strain PA161109" /LENGTH=180 /DNA_ID=CAMNT_0013506669 /DNA_START=76 /DNA_END=618 /DNA_ORIENTATION=-